jgi:hypothetical protein
MIDSIYIRQDQSALLQCKKEFTYKVSVSAYDVHQETKNSYRPDQKAAIRDKTVASKFKAPPRVTPETFDNALANAKSEEATRKSKELQREFDKKMKQAAEQAAQAELNEMQRKIKDQLATDLQEAQDAMVVEVADDDDEVQMVWKEDVGKQVSNQRRGRGGRGGRRSTGGAAASSSGVKGEKKVKGEQLEAPEPAQVKAQQLQDKPNPSTHCT